MRISLVRFQKEKTTTISFYKKIWTMGLNLGILISGRVLIC